MDSIHSLDQRQFNAKWIDKAEIDQPERSKKKMPMSPFHWRYPEEAARRAFGFITRRYEMFESAV
jgi:hypothetical protein